MNDRIEEMLRAGPGPAGDPPYEEAAAAAAVAGVVDVAWDVVDGPIGRLVVATTSDGLVHVGFDDSDSAVERLAERVSPRVLRSAARTDVARRQLDEYFAGRRTQFDMTIDDRLARGFRAVVLRTLYRNVPFGSVTTYKALAEDAGRPKAFRAVGAAMATNPIPVVVPCHRVLSSAGRLHGYAGGIPAKRTLLALEGVEQIPD